MFDTAQFVVPVIICLRVPVVSRLEMFSILALLEVSCIDQPGIYLPNTLLGDIPTQNGH